MGSLIINKVYYFGDDYYFESPELSNGINLIVGDNGSGKSTFSYFIEYGLGGTIKYFSESSKEKYKEIVNDTNNYVVLKITISKHEYILKRYIKNNPGTIFVKELDEYKEYPISRITKTSNKIFSDWILEKLNINLFKMDFGTTSYYFNFNDIYRLLNYDQDTPSRKIYKAPNTDNFITDSTAIRKTIFEVLLGILSNEYTSVLNKLRQKKEEKEQATSLYKNILESNNVQINNFNIPEENEKLKKLKEQVSKLVLQREEFQKNHTEINAELKISEITELQKELTNIELEMSQKEALRGEYFAEYNNTHIISRDIENEINELVKIIHTNDTLNLFSLESCPFCGKPNTHGQDKCICGETITDNSYKKFVYRSSEYKQILDYRKKRLQTIHEVMNQEEKDLDQLNDEIIKIQEKSTKLKKQLHDIISHIHFSGNSQIIDRYNNKILSLREKILIESEKVKLLEKIEKLAIDLNEKRNDYNKQYVIFKQAKERFKTNAQKVLNDFEKLYSKLLSLSSCKAQNAQVDEDYLPTIDSGSYKEKSSIVPIRLMYYYTIFILGLQNKSSNHPHFLMIDTPEEAGIDEDNLKVNLKLLETALTDVITSSDQEYQVILTTGMNKYPESWGKYIKLRLNKKNNEFILKNKKN